MITYAFSVQGKGHIEKGVVCQDSSMVNRLKSGFYIGIVADGVGSAAHSDEGSKTATESLFRYCDENIKKGDKGDAIEDVLRDGYAYALKQVEAYAADEKNSIEDYDTTLSAVIYDGTNVIFGHAGDGGIIARYCDGSTKPITTRQKGADGTSVRPLRAGDSSWEFGFADNVASILLVTDGMLDGVIQPVLVNLPSDRMALARGDFKKDNVYLTASEFFMNPYTVYKNKNVKDPDEYMEYFLKGDLTGADQEMFLKCILTAYVRLLGKDKAMKTVNRIKKYYYTVWAVKNITDDKSVVCIMNEKAKISPREVAYYEEPDWKWRQESYNALLYGKPIPPVSPEDPLYQREGRHNTDNNKSVIKLDSGEDELKNRGGDDFINEHDEKNVQNERKKIRVIAFVACAVLIIGVGCRLMIGMLLGENEKNSISKPRMATSSSIQEKNEETDAVYDSAE